MVSQINKKFPHTVFLAVCQRNRHRGLPVPAPVTTGTDRSRPAPTGPDRHRPAQTGTDRPRPAQIGPGRDRPAPAQTGLNRYKTGTDRPGLFYDVFDKNFLNIMPFWAI
jgi:hypothetical protein